MARDVSLIVLTIAWGAIGVAIYMMWHNWPSRKERRQVQKMKEHAGAILRWTVEGTTKGNELQLSEILMMGINPGYYHMGGVYCNYIQSLSIRTRVEIVDKILDNSSRRCRLLDEVPDLAQIVLALNSTEVETILLCMTKSNSFPDWIDTHDIRYNADLMANEIVAFHLANP